MIELLNKWITGVTVISLMIALAETLVIQEGVRQVLRLAGGILLTVALLSPILRLSTDWDGFGSDVLPSVSALEEEYTAMQQSQLAGVIAEETAAYISDKADEMGLNCTAEVEVEQGEGGIWLPSGAEMSIPYHEQLEQWLESELDIPPEHQKWQEE